MSVQIYGKNSCPYTMAAVDAGQVTIGYGGT